MEKPWFRAKRYGWGWGLPVVWQGWAVLFGFMIVVSCTALLAGKHLAIYFALLVVEVGVLIAICWKTGEKPRWRWGGDDEETR